MGEKTWLCGGKRAQCISVIENNIMRLENNNGYHVATINLLKSIIKEIKEKVK